MKRLIACVLMTLFVTASGHAQTLTGSIIGTVKDEFGASLPGATATTTSPAMPGGSVVSATTACGEYRQVGLPPTFI